MSVSDYRKHHERELKRNPGRFEREQEQARRWSMRESEPQRRPCEGTGDTRMNAELEISFEFPRLHRPGPSLDARIRFRLCVRIVSAASTATCFERPEQRR